MVTHRCLLGGYGPGIAVERLRVAEKLEDLPKIENALRAGALNYSAFRELTRVVTPATEEVWLTVAQGKNLRQIEEMVCGRRPGDTPHDPERPDELRHKMTFRDVTSSTFVSVRDARRALEIELGRRLEDTEFLEALARSVLDPRVGDDGRARHQIAITVCDVCKRGWQDGGGVVMPLDRTSLEVAECDASRIGRLDGEPVRAVQDVAPKTRRLVFRRARRRCQVPGCRSARNLDVHHIVPREKGGSHQASNLVALCSAHHRAMHDGALRVKGTGAGVRPRRGAVVQSHERARLAALSMVRGVDPRGPIPHRGWSVTRIRDALGCFLSGPD